ncbi:autotransporter-associated N-terminal domain-containing protein [Fusobacterium pseudoperiodonticum]|uniref:Autotransporter domain-containing protein n=1 Tax=Fusobacterium pseudoperiodonticum TaxID=2663009 RepID=A0AAD0AK42_9FUSO|nr:autotransporter-associated N-terminal domain-containing protein [Fusobacterium pseudoperiodonticum]ATV36242.1 autotransporter domain-containing protein [Fusobacterium pseudoperiodonticum]ATV60853.1 autotransporter domain-containing protein [Fusobacterium pseudoperiodonticum]
MENNLHRIEKDLRSIAKRYKSVKYSIGLAILFLMLGVSAFSEEVNTKAQVAQIATREELRTSVGDVQTKLNVLRDNNKKEIKNLNLELVQLMEQGAQVVKSPWASWQFGMNFFYENWGGTYKGRGDKSKKYLFNGLYVRGDWKVRNAMDALASQKVSSTPLTPGNDSLASWKNISSSSNAGVVIERNTAINSSVNRNRTWGLVDLLNLKEPTNEVEILARISPKEVSKQALALNITAPVVQTLEAPVVKPEPNKPIEAPKINLPSIKKVTIEALSINPPSAPGVIGVPSIGITIATPSKPVPPTVSVSVNEPSAPGAPTINIPVTPPKIVALNIETPPAVSVTPPTVSAIKPVAFSVDPTIDSNKHKIGDNAGNSSSKDSDGKFINNMNNALNNLPNLLKVEKNTSSSRNFVTINGWNYNTNVDPNGTVTNPVVLPSTKTIDITVDNNRALVIDQTKENFEFHSKGTINLYGSQNMGIDLQGTHTGSKLSPAITTVINDGNIIGYASNKYDSDKANKEQVGFGFSNIDASRNTTMTHMVNNKEITLNAPSSAGMQLKAEDPNNWQPKWDSYPIESQSPARDPKADRGKVLMKADNRKVINLNGSGSFGIITIFNPGLNKNFITWNGYNEKDHNLKAQRDFNGIKILPGGEIGRSALADSKYTSGVYNTGTININGDESVGVGILHEIQEVKVGGTINIGTEAVTQVKDVSDSKSTKTDDQTKVVNNAVGVFAGVPTLPVKVGEADTMGNTNNTGATVGTETTEVSGAINIGRNARESIGLLVGDSEETLNKGSLNGVAGQERKLLRSGSITLKAGPNILGNTLGDGEINIDGNKNYGFVVNSDSNKSVFGTTTDDLQQSIDKLNYGIGINEGKINVKGINSIGFALLKGGNSKNTGEITVKESDITSWHPVTGIVNSQPQYDLTQNSVGFYGEQDKFTNEGTIAVNTPNRIGNKAILLKGNATGITFDNKGDISVNGKNNIGVYAEGKYTFNHEKNTAGNNKIAVGSNAIGIYAKDNTGNINIKAPIELADSNGGTTIGVYSDGNANVKFEDDSKLIVGKKAVGLFSQITANFKNTFQFNNSATKKLEVSLDENSAFAFFNGTGTTDIAEVLNKNIKFTTMKKGATFGYAKGGSVVTLDQDFDTTVTTKVVTTPESGTSVLVASNGSAVQVNAGKTLTTNTNVGLVATNGTSANKSKAINIGTIISKINGGVGLYANSNSEATNETTGKITMENKGSAAILGENNSELKNKNVIELKEQQSAGIYAKDSNATNTVTAGSPSVKAKIGLEKTQSAGMYAVLTNLASGDKKILNEENGTDKATIEIGTNATSSAGMYGKVESTATKVLTLENAGDIQVGSTSSVGIYTENEANDKEKLVAENKGLINVTKESSVGMYSSKESTIKNTGLAINGKGIVLLAKKTAGMIGNIRSEVKNTGDITLSSATQPTSSAEGLVGISLDNTSTATNDGTITVNNDYSTGISGKGGFITNNKNIILNKEKSVGIASTDGNVLNSLTTGKIEVKESSSVGIFAKLTENATSSQTITNEGLITLNGGNTKTSSVGIYSLIEDKAVQAGKAQTIKNTGTIGVGTKSSAGIYVKDNRTIGDNTVSLVKNEGTINVTEESSAGIIGEYSQITNGNPQTKDGTITLSAKKTAGIIANKKSKVMNYGTIETKDTTVGGAALAINKAEDGLVAISANDSTVINKNKENSAGMIGSITLNTAYSTGIYGKNNSILTNEGSIKATKIDSIGMAGENSLLTNKNIILLEEEKSVGMFGTTDDTDPKNTTVINQRDDNNNLTGTITTKKKKSVGIFVSTVKAPGVTSLAKASAINRGTILIEEEQSAGMYGDEANIENTGTSTSLVASITTKKEQSAAMYAKNSNATNKKKITIEGKDSAGILVELTKDKKIVGTNDIADNSTDTTNGLIEVKNEKSVGMLGKVDSSVTTAASKLTLFNKKAIDVDKESSVGMMLINDSTNVAKANVIAENTGVITLKASTGSTTNNKENIGILAKKNSTAINKDNGIINVNTVKSIGMLAQDGSNIENNSNLPPVPLVSGEEYGINLKAEDGVGMLAEGKNSNNEVSTATNNAKIAITSTAEKSIGMYAKDSGDVKNNKEIEVLAKNGVGIFVSDTGKGENTAPNGKILLENKETVGIFAKNNGNGHTAKNSGTINLGKDDGTTTEESLIGMFAQAESGKKASVKNETSGIINVNTKKSVGMYAQNDPANAVGDVDLHNAGTININNAGSAGIYAPKTTVSKVGKINLKDSKDSDGSSAVYISKGGKVEDTSSGIINLGTVNQNRVAYYVNGANSILRSGINDNIGKISGYGVGVYLEGSSKADTAVLDKNTPKLHFTNAALGTTGNGIIGLFLSGNTEVKDYTKGIVVGDTVHPTIVTDDKKYAIGIYADKQGTTGSHYEINTDVTTGKEGVGIFSDSNSVIDYKGHITVGNGTTATKDDEVTAGIGIYITKSTAGNTGTVNLVGSKTDTSITLKGTGGVAVIASEDTKFDGGNATINLVGIDVKGVGVYAKKGSDVNIDNWTFNNNGNAAEEVRSEEGKANITATLKNLKPKMVLSHVINGETSISSSTTVVSVDDLPYKAAANIGLMAEGIKNPAMTWVKGNYEIVNDGIINFSAAEKSTAIYVNSARVKNNKDIKVGKNSTAIYGFYDKNTRKYDGAPTSSDPNKLTIETTAASNISLGDSSTGMYLINAETVTNATGSQITSTTGATKNVGIYAINGAVDKETVAETTAYNVAANYKKLTMVTATNIILGDGSVGLYSKGQDKTTIPTATKNEVTNTGNITVGKTLTGAPAVAIYTENTKLTNGTASATPTITVGEKAIAFYGKNSEIETKGTVNYSNKGILAYLEKSNFTSHYGNLTAHQNTMLFLINSIANMDGAGAKIDITVPDKATTSDSFAGVYVEGKSELNGVKKIEIGKNSNGIFLKDAEFESNVDDIISTKEGAKALLATNSNLINNSKINLSGDSSIGIYSNADATKNVVNNGELTLSGKKTLGVFLRGGQAFENKANINIANSANSLEPTIGIYTAEGTSNIKHTSGTIEVGEKSIGIYSKTPSSVEMNGGKIHVKDQGIGIYKEDGTVVVKGELDIDKHVATAKDTEPTGVYAVNGATVVDQASKITVGEKSYGFILNNTDPNKTNVYTNTNAGPVNLGNDTVFLYSKGKANITNNRNINSNNSDHLIGFYIKDGGEFVNNGIIDFSTGKGNIGVYAPNGKATNRGSIIVGPTDDIDPATGKVYSDVSKIVYGIGMAADNGGHIINEGDIRISTNKSIGMYGAGVGTIVENTGRILLDGSQATATNKIQSLTGVYVDEGATFKNSGLITTTDSYAGRNGKINENVSGLTGVAVMNGSTLINEATGKIYIDADNSTGVIIRGKRDSAGNLIRRAVIKNYGEIKVRGNKGKAISWKDLTPADIAELQRQINAHLISTDPKGNELGEASGTDKDYQGVTITVKNGQATFLRNGVPVSDSEVEKINKLIGNEPNLAMSDIGFYIDTLGRTRPVTFDGAAPPVNSQLIIGTEFSEMTNKKEWIVSGDVIKPFLDQIQGRNFKITTMAGSLTWMATPILDNYGQIVGMAMSKLAYTSFVRPEDNAYNFADGLEQRYDMNALDSAEKRLFNKLNGIGKNEDVLLTQAYDEMMGHQYANVQQRIQATGRILDKEFSYLRNSWSNPSKDSNKVKTFGMKGEYKTDTAGIIDYKNNAYGVAYVHEDETVKLGESTGWYTGIVHNTFKFEDIGKSKEEQLQAKVGLFRSVPFDDNNSLNWTISGDIFVGHNKLNRRFLVVDEIFQAKSKYYTYGIGVRNEVGKEFRLSEGLSVKPYGAVRVEYGRMSKIKEKSGEMKLEVKSNDYLSIRPEVGTELAYKLHLGNKTLRAALAVAYENELGRVANGKNKARVAGTSADWFNIRGEKEDRRGNVKTDLNVGVDNQRIGVTGNVGYDTKGRNVRGGLGLRVIF